MKKLGISDLGVPRLTQGALSASEVVAASLANVAPAMSFMFSFAVVEEGAGLASGLTIVLVAVAILFHANSISQLSKKLPSSGSYITYVGTTFGPVAGIVTAVLAAFGYIVSTAGLMAILGGWTAVILHRFFGMQIPWTGITVIGVVFLGYLMIRGVKISTRWLVMGFFFEVAALILVAFFVLLNPHTIFSWDAFNPAKLKGGLAGISVGFPIAIWMFTGVGNSMGLAEDTKNPRHVIPRSIFISLLFASVIYVFLTWITTIGFQNNTSAITHFSVPFVSLGAAVLGPLAIIVYLAGFTSTFAEIIGATNGQTRMFFSAGRDHLLPRVLSRVNRFHSPWVALIFYLGTGLTITLIWGYYVGPITLFGYLGSLAGIPIALIYLGVNLVVPVYYLRRHREEFKISVHLIVPLLGVITMIFPLAGLLGPSQQIPFKVFPWVVAAILGFGLIYAVWARSRHTFTVGHILADTEDAVKNPEEQML
jgi:amino acid transporter